MNIMLKAQVIKKIENEIYDTKFIGAKGLSLLAG
jgi:hypothetical protein